MGVMNNNFLPNVTDSIIYYLDPIQGFTETHLNDFINFLTIDSKLGAVGKRNIITSSAKAKMKPLNTKIRSRLLTMIH